MIQLPVTLQKLIDSFKKTKEGYPLLSFMEIYNQFYGPTWEQKYNTLLETYRKASAGREIRCAEQVRANINKEYSSLKKENCKYQQIIENIQKWQKTHAEHFNYKIGLELSLIIKKK